MVQSSDYLYMWWTHDGLSTIYNTLFKLCTDLVGYATPFMKWICTSYSLCEAEKSHCDFVNMLAYTICVTHNNIAIVCKVFCCEYLCACWLQNTSTLKATWSFDCITVIHHTCHTSFLNLCFHALSSLMCVCMLGYVAIQVILNQTCLPQIIHASV